MHYVSLLGCFSFFTHLYFKIQPHHQIRHYVDLKSHISKTRFDENSVFFGVLIMFWGIFLKWWRTFFKKRSWIFLVFPYNYSNCLESEERKKKKALRKSPFLWCRKYRGHKLPALLCIDEGKRGGVASRQLYTTKFLINECRSAEIIS